MARYKVLKSVALPAASWLLVIAPLACDSEGIPGPPSGLPHAAATEACGNPGGAAVAIYLAPAPIESPERPPAPYVRMHIWQPLEGLAGRSWVVAGGAAEGGAWFHRTAADFEVATSGGVTVTAVEPDNTVEGWVDVAFPSAGRVRGGFRAAWLPRAMPLLCD